MFMAKSFRSMEKLLATVQKQLWAENVEKNCKQAVKLSMFIILEMSLFWILFLMPR